MSVGGISVIIGSHPSLCMVVMHSLSSRDLGESTTQEIDNYFSGLSYNLVHFGMHFSVVWYSRDSIIGALCEEYVALVWAICHMWSFSWLGIVIFSV